MSSAYGAAPSTVKPQADPYTSYGGSAPACAITRAVFIGINYTGQRGLELKGCVNDVVNSISVFRGLGFNLEEEKNARVLTDKAKRKPTKVEMLAAMAWLTKDCKVNCQLVRSFVRLSVPLPRSSSSFTRCGVIMLAAAGG